MNNIEALRKEKKMTRPELAKQLKVSPATLYCWERGTRNPELPSLIRLADILGVSLDYLLGRTSA